MLVDHAFTVPLQLLWPGRDRARVRTVPVALNTVQHPLPSPDALLQARPGARAAIESYPEDVRVVVLGTGGLSHQLDGERAGFINKEFDLRVPREDRDDPRSWRRYTIHDLVRLAGTQGVELICGS